MSKKQLTLIIVIHNYFESIKYFDSLFSLFRTTNYEVLFVFDCNFNDIPNEYRELLKKYNYTTQERPLSKLNAIINSLDEVKTNFFKIVDQDDSLFLDEIDIINDKLSKTNNSDLIKHTGTKIHKNKVGLYRRFLDLENINKQIEVAKDFKWSQQTNFDTIYPTKVVLMMKGIDFTEQKFHNDVLISNFCVGMGSNLTRIKNRIYIHLYRAGQTKDYNPERAVAIPELYENYIKIKNTHQSFDFKRLMNGSVLKHKIYIYRFTKWYMRKYDCSKAKILYEETLNKINKLNK